MRTEVLAGFCATCPSVILEMAIYLSVDVRE
jgi:hypothetical protein